jgi:hypothetical protein
MLHLRRMVLARSRVIAARFSFVAVYPAGQHKAEQASQHLQWERRGPERVRRRRGGRGCAAVRCAPGRSVRGRQGNSGEKKEAAWAREGGRGASSLTLPQKLYQDPPTCIKTPAQQPRSHSSAVPQMRNGVSLRPG